MSETTKEKRARAPNFSGRDKEILLDVVTKYQAIIENNRTDGTTTVEKDETWDKITNEYNSIVTVARTKVNLKNCYDNMKKTAKKNAAKDKVKRNKTGEEPTTDELDKTGERVLALLGPRAQPLANPFDSDAAYNGEEFEFSVGGVGLITDGELEMQVVGDTLGNVEENQMALERVAAMPIKMVTDESVGLLTPASTEVDPLAVTSKSLWRSWKCRRRPSLPKTNLTTERVSATRNVGDLANAKKKYYERLLEMAEVEHEAKMELMKTKKQYYAGKSANSLNSLD